MTHHHDLDHDHDSSVVVAEDSGTGLGVILGVVVLLLLLAAIWWFTLGPGTGGTTINNTNTDGGTQPVPTEQAPSSVEPQASEAAPSP